MAEHRQRCSNSGHPASTKRHSNCQAVSEVVESIADKNHESKQRQSCKRYSKKTDDRQLYYQLAYCKSLVKNMLFYEKL